MATLAAVSQAIAEAQEGGIDAVREALRDLDVRRIYFVIRVAISGPYSLEGLLRNRVFLTQTTRSTSERALAVDVTETIGRPPFTLRWWVLPGHDIPALEAYLVVRGRVIKVGSKPGGRKRGEWWDESKEVRGSDQWAP